MFDKESQSWIEKGRGVISLNDICQSSSEGIFQSRLGMLSSTVITECLPQYPPPLLFTLTLPLSYLPSLSLTLPSPPFPPSPLSPYLPIPLAVMRMAGSRRLLLNSNMWTEMSCEKVNAKSIRFTGQDVDSGSIRIFLIKVGVGNGHFVK